MVQIRRAICWMLGIAPPGAAIGGCDAKSRPRSRNERWLMPSKRTPVGRPPKSRITPEAIAAFKRMETARDGCTCSQDGWAIGGDCPACEEWWAAHSVLYDSLGLKPWQWPEFEYPDATCPYPAGYHAARQWQRDRDEHPEKLELYRTLQEAAKA